MADELLNGWYINRFPNRMLDSAEHTEHNRWAIAMWLKSHGWTDVACAGVVANVIHESFGNPACWEYCADIEHQDYPGSCGYVPGAYLFAWTPWTKFYSWVVPRGGDEYDACQQMEFLIETLSEYWYLHDYYGLGSDLFPTWQDFAYRSDYTPEQSARAWCSYYEKPNEDPSINHIDERVADAIIWYQKLTTESPPADMPSCAGGGCVYTARLTDSGMDGSKYWYSDTNPFTASGFGLPNCTCYAWGRWWEIWEGNGVTALPDLPLGDGGTWFSETTYSTGDTPKLGAVACFSDMSGGAGHVAIVEEITQTGDYVLSNSAYGGERFILANMTAGAEILWEHFRLQGFIYNPHACKPITPPTPPATKKKSKWIYYLKPILHF